MGFFTKKAWNRCTRLGLLPLALLVGTSCHYFEDDESGSSTSLSQLRGTWLGTVRRANGSFENMTVTLDELARITDVDGDTSWSGELSLYSGSVPFDGFRLYEFTMTDGVTTEEGGFYADENMNHATVVYKSGVFAVLQRGAPFMPNDFNNLDMQRRKTGIVGARFVTWDDNFEVETTGNWIFYTNVITGGLIPYKKDLDPPPFQGGPIQALGNLQLLALTNMGVWAGVNNAADPKPVVVVIMSADKKYAGAYECVDVVAPPGPDFPECEFTLWNIAQLQTAE